MKKLFSLFLAFSLLFLTACNTNPPASSKNPSSSSSSTDKPQSLLDAVPKDTIVMNNSITGVFIHLPSRVMFNMHTNGTYYNVYYSKADGKVYTYCFDPLCDHNVGKCLAVPSSVYDQENFLKNSIDIETIRFINDRFYAVAYNSGKILSFNFDGTDMKMEYDGDYSMDIIRMNGAWTPNIVSYGPYIYIDQRATASEDGKRHVLRFNVETKELEDLTEKTGYYLWPSYFYNGEVYAQTEKFEPVKTNLDFTVYEECDTYKNLQHFAGSKFVYYIQDEKYNILGIGIHDMATGEEKQLLNEELGFSEKGIKLIGMDEDYIYFVDANEVLAGYKIHPKTGKQVPVTKNDGKLYRMDHDGTNIVCIYDDSSIGFSYYDAIVFDGNTIIINATKYRSVEGDTEGLVETHASGYYVGKFGEDGMVEELKPIEFVG